MAIVRQPQSFFLPFSDEAAGTTVTTSGTLQQASLLQDPVMSCAVRGLLTAFTVAGQSILASDQGSDIDAWVHNAQYEGHRGIGINLDQNQVVSVTAELASSSVFRFGVGIDPCDPADVDSVNDLGDGLNYAFGLGSVTIGDAETGELSAEARRDCLLGMLGISYTAVATHVIENAFVHSILVNNLELLNGLQTAGLTLSALLHTATDIDGRCLCYPISTNDTVVVKMTNDDATSGDDMTIRGNIFCMDAESVAAAA